MLVVQDHLAGKFIGIEDTPTNRELLKACASEIGTPRGDKPDHVAWPNLTKLDEILKSPEAKKLEGFVHECSMYLYYPEF